jgi:hypothetical protein
MMLLGLGFNLLKQMSWVSSDTNMYDYYRANMNQLGEVPTYMERREIRVLHKLRRGKTVRNSRESFESGQLERWELMDRL